MVENSAMTEMDILAAAEQGALILTVNQRLARYLIQTFDQRMQARDCPAWKSPGILFHLQWQRQMASRLRLDENTLTQSQALLLWERAVEEEEQRLGKGQLLRVPDAARGAAQAHQLLCEYGVTFSPEEGGEDHRAFLRWRQRYQKLCEEGAWSDPALLASRLVKSLETTQVPLPKQLWLAGFDELTPSVAALCQVLEKRGVIIRHWSAPVSPMTAVGRSVYADPEDEMRSCARWVRQLLAGQAERIGIVAVDMNACQRPLQRIFREELSPAALLPGAGADKAFNLSLGTPLLDEGLVLSAFELLGLGRKVTLDSISYLLRSPFVWGYAAEGQARAILDRELRNLRMTELPLRKVVQFAELGFKKKLGRADIFARQLETIQDALGETELQLPGTWASHFAELLDNCQWSRDRSLTSREFQVFSAWKELLAGMAGLDAVSRPMKRKEALALLRRLASETIFQPEGSAGRVQVLGPLEAAGMEFDALWLLGAHDEALPAAARPNPFIPPGVQRRLKMPHADAARELDFARKISDRLLTAAPEVVVSWPRSTEGRERQPSPLIQHLPLIEPQRAESQRPASLIQQTGGSLESLSDPQGPAIPEGVRVSGGTAILKDQALCPFRAYARHRLGAQALAVASLGLDGLDRGSLVHRTLELFWEHTGNWQNLMALDVDARFQRCEACAKQALDERSAEWRIPLPKSQRLLEQQRLAGLLVQWLEVEAQRPPFNIETMEAWHREKFGPLTLQTRIDRIDRLADGSQVIIDYKTGMASVGDWLGERPVEPQLPLYTLGRRDRELAALSFARVRLGECAFIGLGREQGLLPGVVAASDHRQLEKSGIADWEDLLGIWRETLRRLADQFSSGQAAVQPISIRQACERCDLQALCRIADENGLKSEEELS